MPALSKIIQLLFDQRKELIIIIKEQREYIKKLEKELISLKDTK
jgi:hypothetical protein